MFTELLYSLRCTLGVVKPCWAQVANISVEVNFYVDQDGLKLKRPICPWLPSASTEGTEQLCGHLLPGPLTWVWSQDLHGGENQLLRVFLTSTCNIIFFKALKVSKKKHMKRLHTRSKESKKQILVFVGWQQRTNECWFSSVEVSKVLWTHQVMWRWYENYPFSKGFWCGLLD